MNDVERREKELEKKELEWKERQSKSMVDCDMSKLLYHNCLITCTVTYSSCRLITHTHMCTHAHICKHVRKEQQLHVQKM